LENLTALQVLSCRTYTPANKGKPSAVRLDVPDLWISAAHRTLDRSDEVDEGTAMMSQCSHDSFEDHKPGSQCLTYFT